MPISLENRFPKSLLNMENIENERVVGKVRWSGGTRAKFHSGWLAKEGMKRRAGNYREKRATFVIRATEVKPESSVPCRPGKVPPINYQRVPGKRALAAVSRRGSGVRWAGGEAGLRLGLEILAADFGGFRDGRGVLECGSGMAVGMAVGMACKAGFSVRGMTA